MEENRITTNPYVPPPPYIFKFVNKAVNKGQQLPKTAG